MDKRLRWNGTELPPNLVHGDMHCRETKHGANRDGDEKLLSELEERQPVSDASAEDVSDELVQEGPYW